MRVVRVVEVIGGPQDGAQALVDAGLRLPDRIVFPMEPGQGKVYVYKLVEKSAKFSAYRYDCVEVAS